MTDKKKKTETRKKAAPGYLEVAIISSIMACIAIFAYNRYLAPKTMTVDLKGYVKTQKALLAAGELDEAGFRKKMDRFDQQVNAYMSKHPNDIIILKDVVIRQSNDSTITIK